MCGDCWNAAMAAPTAVVAARFAWIGYKDRIPFLGRRHDAPTKPDEGAETTRCQAPRGRVDPDLVEAGAPPP
ncbi:MAG TPA: hypothetical protein VGO60_13775 [Iamia sp.]|jgi:hypothetical protein|nr:hypothetical protein [Iamia sp.]